MAVTAALLTEGESSVDATSYVTASITPGANRLILAAVANTRATIPAAPTLSGNGLTWVEVVTFDYPAVATVRVSLFRAMGAAPSAGAVTIDLDVLTHTGCHWAILEFDGVDTGGTNGSAAVVQNAINEVDAGATSLTVTLAAFGSADNATFGMFQHSRNEGKTPGAGFTELSDNFHATPGSGMETEWRADNDTSVDASWVNLAGAGGIAIEIKAAAVGASIAFDVGHIAF